MIKAENVNYIYQQGMPFERQALYDVNIEIEDGSLVALIGHTGSGKSTLIQHFNALVKPTSGKIIINGIDYVCISLGIFRCFSWRNTSNMG